MRENKTDGPGYLGWFLLGAVLGAAVAFLTAPRPGRETRELLAERGGEAARRAQQWATEAQSHAGEWLERSRELLEEQTKRLLAAFEAGKEAMREEIRKWAPPARG